MNDTCDNYSKNICDKIKIPPSWRVVIILSCISGMVVYGENMLPNRSKSVSEFVTYESKYIN
jgi:tryptophan-rich sensory protein